MVGRTIIYPMGKRMTGRGCAYVSEEEEGTDGWVEFMEEEKR